MDAIFDDMVGTDENGNIKDTAPVNTVAIENLVVNPKFEGGPHIKPTVYPNIAITSSKKQNLANFSEMLHVIGNIHYIIESQAQLFIEKYGFCSQLYQLGFVRSLTRKMNNICLIPSKVPLVWLPFETDDPYL
jgi:hypothetical protein